MKRLEVFLLPLDGMLVHCRVTPSIKLAYLYTWVEREALRVKCCVPEHSNVPSQGLYPDFLISRDERNNHETTHLPQFTTHLLQNVFSGLKILCRLQSCTAKTSFASHCKSLEIKFLGRKRGNVYFLEIFSNTPTIKEVNLTEIDSFSWQNVQE